MVNLFFAAFGHLVTRWQKHALSHIQFFVLINLSLEAVSTFLTLLSIHSSPFLKISSVLTGYVFCMLHRLPEQHDCTFDHMGRGREEAIMKMVKLDRKVGRSCQRIGEGCS